MATNIPTKQFYGTSQTNRINTNVDIADGNFSGAPAATYDNSTDRMPFAIATAKFPGWGATPTADTVVELWGIKKDVNAGGDDDTDAPSGTARNGAQYMGAFPLAAINGAQQRTITLNMMGIDKMDFYFRNRSGTNMNNDGGTNATLDVTPMNIGAVTP